MSDKIPISGAEITHAKCVFDMYILGAFGITFLQQNVITSVPSAATPLIFNF